MTLIRKQGNRRYPSLPTPGEDIGQHRVMLELIKESLEIHERRTGRLRDSFVQVGELIDLGILREVNGQLFQARTSLRTLTASWVSSSALTASADNIPIFVPFDAQIRSVALATVGGTGSCSIDILRGAIGSYPPSNSIVASAPPSISSGTSDFDAELSGWDTKIFRNDVLLFDISSTSTFTSIHCFLNIEEVAPYEL